MGREGLDTMITTLGALGYRVIGPTVSNGAINYDEIHSTSDLPEGWGDDQDGGKYRLVERRDSSLFGYNLGQASWKRLLHPPRVELLQVTSTNGGLSFRAPSKEPARMAFIGVRACELAAIDVQDRVFLGPVNQDPTYASRRAGVFIVAVNCGTAAATCFCSSMGTGPRCGSGYDLALTEVLGPKRLEYVVEAGSTAGEAILFDLPGREAVDEDLERAAATVAGAEESMRRSMDTAGLPDILLDNLEHPRWEQVASRCLTCGNCTSVCPTCFCSTTIDTVNSDGQAIRSRIWDSCFSLDFSGLHGQPVRSSTKSRYRQWMTHKLATWHDQFGVSGCVGCGRCITWCPVGIDITAEVAAIRETVEK